MFEAGFSTTFTYLKTQLVEKEQFNYLLVNYTSLIEEEALHLSAVLDEFPYSQVVHNLAARAAQDSNLPSKGKLLHLSAVYSTDRSAFKAMMIAPKRDRVVVETPVVNDHGLEKPLETSTGDLHEQVFLDIAILQESKRQFELIIEQMDREKPMPLAEAKEVHSSPSTFKGHDSLIDEIESTKKKVKPEGVKQKEQIEIIDQFIKTQPSLQRPKPTSEVAQVSDLSEPSAEFGENIVSETLVEILLKQGKKEKAIEALKKLIWKFPQKKTYFAAQIEELRK